VDLLTHPLLLLALVEQVVLALVEQAVLRQDLLHLDTLLLKHLPDLLPLHLVAALDLHLQVLRVVLLKVVSLSITCCLTCLLQAWFSAPLPHFLMAMRLADLLSLLWLILTEMTTVLVLLTTLVEILLLER